MLTRSGSAKSALTAKSTHPVRLARELDGLTGEIEKCAAVSSGDANMARDDDHGHQALGVRGCIHVQD